MSPISLHYNHYAPLSPAAKAIAIVATVLLAISFLGAGLVILLRARARATRVPSEALEWETPEKTCVRKASDCSEAILVPEILLTLPDEHEDKLHDNLPVAGLKPKRTMKLTISEKGDQVGLEPLAPQAQPERWHSLDLSR